MTKEKNGRARKMFEKAIDLDPHFAGAYVGLGWTYFQGWTHRWDQDPKSLDTAIELGRKAIAMDPSFPSAYRLLSECHSWKREYTQALAEIEAAIALDPNDAENYADLSNALLWVNRLEEAIAQMEKAMRLNPYYPVIYLFGVGLAQFMMGKNEEAIATLRKVLIRAPDLLWAHGLLAAIFVRADRIEEASAEIAEISRIDPDYRPDALEIVPFKDPRFAEEMAEVLHKVKLTE